ncbi:hypothetical protein UFOVP10_22 [uncultured Caudovirales phage]|uniref:Uncharacterized protein n=1 Tax=uncultured Caudovirales phage TaxID=2100421 RepID=A0A6J5KLH6_9CAUD|nr:hypothetical protein UFOVP10_22 [uncultured Caudovirales phage]
MTWRITVEYHEDFDKQSILRMCAQLSDEAVEQAIVDPRLLAVEEMLYRMNKELATKKETK